MAAAVVVLVAAPVGIVAAGWWGGESKPVQGVAPGESTGAGGGSPAIDASASAVGGISPIASAEPVAVASAGGPQPSGSVPSAGEAGPTVKISPTVTGKANPSGANLALEGLVTASGVEGDPWAASLACDGDRTTRWSSAFADPQWIRVDLRRNWRLSTVTLVWERSYGVAYRVETSVDGRTWKRIWATADGRGGTVEVDASGTVARYVRMYGTKRVSTYGYSLFELEIR